MACGSPSKSAPKEDIVALLRVVALRIWQAAMEAFIPVFAAAIGAFAALLGGWFGSARQLKLEAQKIELEKTKLSFAQEASLKSEARQSIQECIGIMASATHSMCWLTWVAAIDSKRITEERLKQYDEEMHILLPKAIGRQANVSTYSAAIGNSMSKILKSIEYLDARIGESAIRYLAGEAAAIDALIGYHAEATKLHDDLENAVKTFDMKSILAEIS